MLGIVWNTLLFRPLLNLLVFFYQLFGQSLGWAVIALTLVTRFLVIPLTLPALKTAEKQKKIAPKLKELQAKYKNDKKKLSEEQLKLFKEEGINPGSGCLLQIFMIIILIALYQAFNHLLVSKADSLQAINQLLYLPAFHLRSGVNPRFLFWDLTQPDRLLVLPILAAVFQFLHSKMMLPVVERGEKLAESTVDRKDDVAYNMQEQFLYLTPMMTIFIGLKLPAGLVLYWLVTTVFSLGQQYLLSGWGGLAPWINRIYGKNRGH
ncbi:MAG: YidC/Oxa1 family membrane protein insertase [bacterium]|nr:YidC/Oxa1 family membrane protein insertase [bacterium]